MLFYFIELKNSSIQLRVIFFMKFTCGIFILYLILSDFVGKLIIKFTIKILNTMFYCVHVRRINKLVDKKY